MKSTIKIISLLSTILVFLACSASKKVVPNNSTTATAMGKIETQLIGTWNFVELKNKDDVKIDTIRHAFGHEIPKGPLITLKSDGTYTKQFTPENIDSGTWYVDEKENTIVYWLYYDKPYDKVAQHLIDTGHSTKDENGDYYEVLKNKITFYSESDLILEEGGGKQRSFMRILDN